MPRCRFAGKGPFECVVVVAVKQVWPEGVTNRNPSPLLSCCGESVSIQADVIRVIFPAGSPVDFGVTGFHTSEAVCPSRKYPVKPLLKLRLGSGMNEMSDMPSEEREKPSREFMASSSFFLYHAVMFFTYDASLRRPSILNDVTPASIISPK